MSGHRRGNRQRSAVSMFEPEMVLPQQYFDCAGIGSTLQPERRLMLAVLEDAVATFQRYVSAAGARGQRLFREAEEWIFSEDQEWPFSFENVCNALEIESAYLRNGLMRWKQHPRAARGGTGNVYRFPFRRVNGRRHSISLRRDSLRRSA